MAYYISKHPAFYGLSKLSSKTSADPEGALKTYLAKLTKSGTGTHGKGMFLHPLFVELQEQSPMGPNKNFTISEIDWNRGKMEVSDFYKNHVS